MESYYGEDGWKVGGMRPFFGKPSPNTAEYPMSTLPRKKLSWVKISVSQDLPTYATQNHSKHFSTPSPLATTVLRTKHIELIHHNMPVIINDIHTCVRIREIMGECDDVFTDENIKDSDTEDDYNSSPNIDTENEAQD
ncbi:hypothetical protein Tco_1001772 [Tanacetum coccineum]